MKQSCVRCRRESNRGKAWKEVSKPHDRTNKRPRPCASSPPNKQSGSAIGRPGGSHDIVDGSVEVREAGSS